MNSIIKRVIWLSLVISMLFAFVGCRKNPALDDSALSEEIEYVYLNTPSTEEKTESNDEISSGNSEVIQSNNSNNSSDTSVSTVKTPKQAFLYKDGKKYTLTDTNLNLQITREVENWFKDKEQPSYTENTGKLWDIKCIETSIELIYDEPILLNGKDVFKGSSQILFSITGSNIKHIFYYDDINGYLGKPVERPSGTTLNNINNIIKSLNLEKLTNSSASTVTVPKEAFLYKDGKKYSLKDAELNLRIAKRVESWYAEGGAIAAASLAVNEELIWEIKSRETAIEFFYDDEILLNGQKGVFGRSRGFLIPITGDYNKDIFKCDGNGVYYSGPLYSPQNSSLDDVIKSIDFDALDELENI